MDKDTIPGAKHSDGIAGIKEQVRVIRAAFPDSHWQVQEFIELPEEGRIATRDRWTGTHLGDFMGIKKTGKKIDVVAMAYVRSKYFSIKANVSTRFSRMEGGKIVQSEMMFDKFSLLQQLGATLRVE